VDPKMLIGPSSPLGYPAPYWFLVFFKVLGFTLHMIPMSLWHAGIILALLMRSRGGEHARHLSDRLMKQMPIMIAAGVNFGIVPLLFTQVAYYKVFYPATILMAWPWFSIIIMLTLAYYGVYIYTTGLRDGNTHLTPLRRAAGWAAAVLFVVIGFIFTSAFVLMTKVEVWPRLWEKFSVAGAPLGIAHYASDPTSMPRWLMMLGLALMTTAAWMVVDTAIFAAKESQEYKQWAMNFALKVYTGGMVWFALTGSWYTLGAWQAEVREVMLSGSHLILTALTALSPGLPWLLILMQRKNVTPSLALIAGLSQFVVLALNATSRQIVQNLELKPFLDVTAEPVNMQWSPLILFLVLFVIGLGVVIGMVTKIWAVRGQPAAAGK